MRFLQNGIIAMFGRLAAADAQVRRAAWVLWQVSRPPRLMMVVELMRCDMRHFIVAEGAATSIARRSAVRITCRPRSSLARAEIVR
jgi:hypothetical protein